MNACFGWEFICLFFPIIREMLSFLGVALGQLMPNGWRYFLVMFLLWPTIFLEFFNICDLHIYPNTEAVTFIVRGKNQFIEIGIAYSNNKYWSEQFFYIYGDQEASLLKGLPLEHTVPREWGASKENCECFKLFSSFNFLFYIILFWIRFFW